MPVKAMRTLLFLMVLSAAPACADICNVRDFGATGVKTESATRAIQAAVDKCAAAGGGTVLVPPGEYTTGSIRLKDNIDLRVEAGARLLSSLDPKEFPREWHTLIYANGARHIGISGAGTIDGQGRYEWSPARQADPEIAEERGIAEKAGMEMKRYNHAGPQIFLVQFIDSSDVRFEDVRLLNSQIWTIRLLGCQRVTIRGVYVYTDPERAVNGDGIDLVSTRDVTISDSTIVTGDDSICLKTEAVNGGPARPTENIAVTNCILQSSSTPLMIGTESLADIRHVLFSNCIIRDSNKAFGINVQDGATVEDIRVSNITFELNRRHWNWWGSAEAFYLVLKRRSPESKLGSIRNVVIDGMSGVARGTSRAIGDPDRPIENLTVRNLNVRQASENTRDKRTGDAVLFDRVDGLKLENVTVRWQDEQPEPAWKSALVLRRVRNLDIQGLDVRQGLLKGPSPAVWFEDVQTGWVRGVRAQAGTGVLFGTSGDVKEIRFSANDARFAAKEFDGFPPVLRGF
jgi:hypothetical protein